MKTMCLKLSQVRIWSEKMQVLSVFVPHDGNSVDTVAYLPMPLSTDRHVLLTAVRYLNLWWFVSVWFASLLLTYNWGFGVFNEHSVHLLFYFCRVLWTGSWNCGHLMSCIPNLGQHLVGASKPWSFNVMASQRQRFIIRSLLLLEQHSYWSQMLRGMPSMQFTWSLEHLLFTPGWTTWLSSRWHTPSSALQLRMMWSSIKLARAAFKCFVCKHKQSNNTHLRCHNAFPCHVMTCNPKAPIPVPPSRPWYHHHRHKCPWQTQMPTTLGFHQECQ